jgi:hypothetical protein
MIQKPNKNGGEPSDECTCDWLHELHIKRLLVHGVIVRCGTCGGVYSSTESEATYDLFVKELSLPDRDGLVLRFDDK